MKVAISCTGQLLEDDLDQRFGRAEFFLVVDSETLKFTAIDNAARSASGGAGIAAAQTVIDQHADALITGQLGPNALNVLSSADISLYQGIDGSAYNNIIAFNQQKLVKISESGPSHAGIGRLRDQS